MSKFTKVSEAFVPASVHKTTGTLEYDEDIIALAEGEMAFLPVEQPKARGLALTLHRAASRLRKARKTANYLFIEQGDDNGTYGIAVRVAKPEEANKMAERAVLAKDRNKKPAALSPGVPGAQPAAKVAAQPKSKVA